MFAEEEDNEEGEEKQVQEQTVYLRLLSKKWKRVTS